jgi:hypothetical protein
MLPTRSCTTLQVLVGGAQAQFGLVAAHVQARHTGGLFQDEAAFLRLRVDHRRNAALC